MKKSILVFLISFTITHLSSAQDQKFSLEIDLTDLSISIDSIISDVQFPPIIVQRNDSIFIELEMGDEPTGINLRVLKSSVRSISISQKFETSLSIMGDGPHLELTDWKHFTSEWQKLENIKYGLYKTFCYSTKESEQFPEVKVEEVKTTFLNVFKIKNNDSWQKTISEITSIYEYPCSVGISRILFKIEYEMNKKIRIKHLIFEIPMGC